MLSKRGSEAVDTAVRPDLELFFKAVENVYEPNNPTGNFILNIAENKTNRNLIGAILKQKAQNDIPDWVFSYTDTTGAPSFRAVLANLLDAHFNTTNLSPDTIAIASGAAAIIELTSFCIADPSDVVLIPAPGYPVYSQDMGIKARLERINIQGANPFESDYHPLTLEDVEQSYNNQIAAGKKVACIVLTSPDNPTGQIYDLGFLEVLADWCIDHKVHLILNEIYGLSTISVNNSPSFKSFLPSIQSRNSPFLHWWYSLSKDFGISGLRVGVLCSMNDRLIKSFSNIAVPHMVSNHTQWLLEQVLSDNIFVTNYLEKNKSCLNNYYVNYTQVFDKHGIPYVKPTGSLFLWLDFRAYLSEKSKEGELEFWESFFTDTGLLLTPGIGFGHKEYGFFRLVTTAVTPQELPIVCERFDNYFQENPIQ